MELKYDFEAFKATLVSTSQRVMLDFIREKQPVSFNEAVATTCLHKANRINANRKKRSEHSQGNPSSMKKYAEWLIEIGAVKQKGELLSLNKDFIPKSQKE